METVEEFAALLRRRFAGVLATHSRREAGYPFASRVPYCCDPQGSPLLAVSALAEHTRNLLADPRVALSVWDEQQDVQAAPRATLLGEMEPATEDDHAALYCAHFPAAQAYLRELDFRLYRLRPRAAHYVAGFASVHWLDAAALGRIPAWDAGRLQRARRQLSTAVLARLIRAPTTPALAGIDPQGLTARSAQTLERVAFTHTLDEPEQIAAALPPADR